MDTALMIEKLKERYNMQPLVGEGGLFSQVYICEEKYPLSSLPERYKDSDGDKPYGTVILFLLTENTFSRMHRLPTDEVYHFYLGDPVEMLQLLPDKTSRVVHLGQDVLNGMDVQTIVPKGAWQGSRLMAGGKYALIGCTMAPGYTASDYVDGYEGPLFEQYPDVVAPELLKALTKEPRYN